MTRRCSSRASPGPRTLLFSILSSSATCSRCADPAPRHFPDYDWCTLKKARPTTAQSTPRYMNALATPTKSVCGGGYISSLNCHSYMSSTQSFEAKVRSHSAPKQRPEPPVGTNRKRDPLSDVVEVESRASLSGVSMQQWCNRVQEAFNFKTVVVGRLDRSSEAAENDQLVFLQRRW